MYFENKKLLARKLPVKPTVFCLYEGPLDTLNFWQSFRLASEDLPTMHFYQSFTNGTSNTFTCFDKTYDREV